MTGHEIRETFLRFFEERGHVRVPSSPLLPANDPTLLFANAGMNQFKDVFTGVERRPYKRATSAQKCIRAGGKHNDLDDVGKTARHHTFFEMLGNFSFGDYFKREAIEYALDLLLNVYKLPLERLWFTVYETDDEAAELWVKAGASPERVLRFGAKENFWQMGDTGPCGPCSEIHYYQGPDPHDPTKNRAELVNGPGDETIEIWNLVFMQYDRSADGTLTPLPAPSVDTGAGLERLAAVLQGVRSNFDTDLLRPLVDFAAELAGRPYVADSHEGFAMRVIADHARATAFSIADGIYPGNEGRNYVLRKIMRRAIYHGRHALGLDRPFFHRVTDKVVEMMRGPYPELEAARALIERIVKSEEERFGATLSTGLQKLEALLATVPYGEMPDYKELARLYDTFGTPRDLIRVSLEERGISIPEDEFNLRFEEALGELQRASARSVDARAKTKEVYARLAERLGRTEFTGYEGTRLAGARIVALIRGDEEVAALHAGEEGELVLDRTPFYAEAGGQVGDTGVIVTSRSDARVLDTQAPVSGLIVHRVRVERGEFKAGDEVTAQVDEERRNAIRRNHTATHLLHAALREVLGAHVKQAGSLVAPNRLRFDFTHFQPLTAEEIAEIERLVNDQILRNVAVQTEIMPLAEALRSGAMALFGEKYGERVRVLTVPGFSKELCGGTHVRATGDIGPFKIVRDEAVASGTRRVEAITGTEAIARFQEDEELVNALASELRTARERLPETVEKLQEELRRARREVEELRLKLAAGGATVTSTDGEVRDCGGVRVLVREVSDLDASGLRQLSDTLLARLKSGVVVLGRRAEGKASLLVRVSADLRSTIQAGQVIRELAPILGGRGGGRPDLAEGGGPQAEKLQEALSASYAVIERLAKTASAQG
ncbi:MAG: alanine--tRNA ligase [Pyrinomonas methylaliphatogenes]|nr:alanine--tRNA ligase [Pyrinomonas methylaliphatogenes]